MTGDPWTGSRGRPLRLCARDHPPWWHAEAACPYCALRAELVQARAELAQARAELAQARAAGVPASASEQKG